MKYCEKHVLLVTPDLKDIGGVANYYDSVLPLLGIDEFKIDHLEIGSTKGRRTPYYPLNDQFRFHKAIKKKPSIVHLNPSLNIKSFIRDGLFIFHAKRCKIPVIVFFHGWNKKFAQKIEKYFLIIFHATYGQADAFIVLASEFKEKLLSWNISAPIYLETTTVDPELLRNYAIEDRVLTLGKKEPLRILFLARIERAKGVFETVDAIALLLKNGFPVTLSIAGDGPAKTALEEYTQSLNLPTGKIRFLGYIRGFEKIAAFSNHDLYCFPSYYGEGLPISVLEALAFGIPVITCSVGGLADIFYDGQMGAIVPVRNAEAIANKIKKLSSDRQSMVRIARNNHSFAAENLMAPKIASRIIEIYRKTICK